MRRCALNVWSLGGLSAVLGQRLSYWPMTLSHYITGVVAVDALQYSGLELYTVLGTQWGKIEQFQYQTSKSLMV